MAGLYLHIPFCKRVCAYCDFLRIIDCSDARGGMDSPDAIFARIRTEIERFR